MSSSSGYAGQSTGLTRAGGGNRQVASSSGSTNLADLLERVLDKGIVIAGDITVSLGQVELLSIKLRLIVASIDKAQEIGIDWWRSDPALSSHARQLEQQNQELKARLDRIDQRLQALPAPQQASQQAPDAASFANDHGRASAPSPGAPSQPATPNTSSAPNAANTANTANNAGAHNQPAPSDPVNPAGPASPEANGRG